MEHIISIDADIVTRPGQACATHAAVHGEDGEGSSTLAHQQLSREGGAAASAAMCTSPRSRSLAEVEIIALCDGSHSAVTAEAPVDTPSHPASSSSRQRLIGRFKDKWSSRTMDDIAVLRKWSSIDAKTDISSSHPERDTERQHHARFNFGRFASAAEGAASLAQSASTQMSALGKRMVASRIQVLRWLRNEAEGENESCKIGSDSQVEESRHKLYGGMLTFPLVSPAIFFCYGQVFFAVAWVYVHALVKHYPCVCI
jgi:hypothetical protein